MNKLQLLLIIISIHTNCWCQPIIGGKSVQNDFEFVVGLSETSSANTQFCGGTLIAPNWVLTAAHCLENLNTNDFKIFTNAYVLSNQSSFVIYNPSEIIIHPDYNSITSDHDIALIKLQNSSNLPKVKIVNQYDSSFIVNQLPQTVLGWGLTSEDPEIFSDTLMKVDIKIIAKDICNRAISYDGKVTKYMFCAGDLSGGKDACGGDSGGPILTKVNNNWVQTGIVSWGNICGDALYPGVYTNLCHYSQWIESKTGISLKTSNISKSSQIQISKDINNQTLKVISTNQYEIIYQIFMYDLKGNTLNQTQNSQILNFQVKEKGIYFIKVITNQGTFIKKIIIS